MYRFIAQSVLILGLVAFVSCSASNSTPTLPSDNPGMSHVVSTPDQSAPTTSLWGYYDITIDPETLEVEIHRPRSAAFTVNVVEFLNKNPMTLSIQIQSTDITASHIDVDVDVTLTHPFPGYPQYHGYDVRGVFMGNGSGTMEYGNGLTFAVDGTDQGMNPGLSGAASPGPDGYTRWYNLTEFSEGAPPIFSYTDGTLASEDFDPTATLNPYKYFADGLDVNDDLWTWLNANTDSNGQFSSGASNSRNYTLRFPTPSPGIRFGYAVIADWAGAASEYHPSNALEAMSCSVVDNSDIYFNGPGVFGGNINLDLSLYGWDQNPSTIYIESSVLQTVYEFSPGDMIPVGGSDVFSTWHIEIPADNVTGTDGNEFWIIAEYPDQDYSNPFDYPNLAVDTALTTFFRHALDVTEYTGNIDPVCDLVLVTAMPLTELSPVVVEFDASGSSDINGDPLTFEWDFDGDGNYDEDPDDAYKGDPSQPIHGFLESQTGPSWVRVSDGKGGVAECSVDVDVTAIPSKNLPLRDVEPRDIAVDPGDGDVLILYDDLQIWRRFDSEYYQTPSHLVTTHPSYPNQSRIDINSDGWFLNAGFIPAPLNRPMGQFRDETGGDWQPWNFEWGPFGFVSDEYRFIDVIAFGDNGTHAKDIGPFTGAPFQGNHDVRFLNLTDTGKFHSWTRYINSHSGTDHIGMDILYYDYVVGAESDQVGDFIWFLENTDFYATRWSLSPPVGNSVGTFAYDGINFGTGVQTDDDDGWNDSKDLCRDDQNKYFVLDELSTGDPRIKTWSFDGSVATSLGGFGDSTSISGPPLRIEGSDYSGLVFVIHGDSTDGWFLSIFKPFEMP